MTEAGMPVLSADMKATAGTLYSPTPTIPIKAIRTVSGRAALIPENHPAAESAPANKLRKDNR